MCFISSGNLINDLKEYCNTSGIREVFILTPQFLIYSYSANNYLWKYTEKTTRKNIDTFQKKEAMRIIIRQIYLVFTLFYLSSCSKNLINQIIRRCLYVEIIISLGSWIFLSKVSLGSRLWTKQVNHKWVSIFKQILNLSKLLLMRCTKPYIQWGPRNI